MDIGGVVSLKIYFSYPSYDEPEIRRFAVHPSVVTCFNLFTAKLAEKIPELCQTGFRIFWKDEEDEEVSVSSDEELTLALTSMKNDLKKFYVKLGPVPKAGRNESYVVHPQIYCNGCEANVAGFRYKCIVCHDFDLCEACERDRVHSEHPMLRIPDPGTFKRSTLQKITYYLEAYFAKDRHRERKHGHDGTDESYPESHKKPKKWDRRDAETADEYEEGGHRKHSHHSYKKMKKGKCPYGQMVNTVFQQMAPEHSQAKYSHEYTQDYGQEYSQEYSSQEPKKEEKEESLMTNPLGVINQALQAFLEPLMGGNFEFEFRPVHEKRKEKRRRDPAKETPPPSPSAPQQKEVRFADCEEVTKQKVDEIAKLLAKQTMNGSNGESSRGNKNEDADGWVELEVLEKDPEDDKSHGAASTAAHQPPKVRQSAEKVPGGERQQEVTKAPTSPQDAAGSHSASPPQAPEPQPLYPDLGAGHIDASVKDALEQLISMGFTNENNLLTLLLKAKGGNVSQTLDMLLEQQKKN